MKKLKQLLLWVMSFGEIPLKEEPPKPDPIIGAKYIIEGGNPFERVTVVVSEVREGWVRYFFIHKGRVGLLPDYLQVSTFNDIYTIMEKPNEKDIPKMPEV